MRFAAAMLGVAGMLWAGGAAAQSDAPGRGEPTSTLLETMCTPWLAGVDAGKFWTDAEAKGFRKPVGSDKLEQLYTPKAMFAEGWQSVVLAPSRQSCSIVSLMMGDDLKYLSVDIGNSLIRNYPAGAWENKVEDWKDGEFGKATRVRAWNSKTQEIVLTETPDAGMTKEQGRPVVVVTVVVMRVG